MCVAIPGIILTLNDDNPLSRSGKVNFGGVERVVNLALLPEASIGDYVLVHAGFAISQIDEDEAMKVFRTLSEWGDSDGE